MLNKKGTIVKKSLISLNVSKWNSSVMTLRNPLRYELLTISFWEKLVEKKLCVLSTEERGIGSAPYNCLG